MPAGRRKLRKVGFMEVKIDPKTPGAWRTVLVVDDNEVVRKAIETAFLSDGFNTCVEARNGAEAIEVAKQCQPDLIILDLSMPVMNGLEAAPILRKMFPQVPIFLFSLYGECVSKEDASRPGWTWLYRSASLYPMSSIKRTRWLQETTSVGHPTDRRCLLFPTSAHHEIAQP
jgi:CheY-like chemotaxis protein